MTTQLQRQSLGCGYEPRTDRVSLLMWQPPQGAKGYSGPPLEWCAGYTTSLPEVMETAIARVHWSKGNAAALGELTEETLNSIVILEGSYNELQRWMLTPLSEGGGGR